jgi:CSLREA domain-containing protein
MMILALSATSVQAATYVVDSTVDAVDVDPFDGICATASATCTLRAAVQTANATAGADVISLPAGTYTLTIAGDFENGAAEGDLDVTDALTIAGAGAATTILDGNGFDQVLELLDTSLEIRDVTIRHGQGGLATRNGSLTVTRVVVTENGLVGTGIGGIAVRSYATPTTCLVTDSTISNNRGSAFAGGITVNRIGFAALTVTVFRSTIVGNQAGGFTSNGTLVIDECTIADNSAGDGGGVYTYGGVLTLTRSTVAGNIAAQGGGVVAGSNGLIENTTISGNAANGNVGGLAASAPFLQIRNVTITDNVADADADGHGDGGGFGGTSQISNSIIAGNIDRGGEADDCVGAIASGGFNLIGRAEACVIGGDLTGDVLGLAPALGPLAMNGGPTATHALLPGSPALDAGNPALPGSGPTACATTDQRSVARPYAGACDMGALEATYVVTSCGNGTIDGGDQCDDGNVRSGDCCTATCQLDGSGTLCADGDVCTDNACNGAGSCIATNNTSPCNDGQICTVGETCSAGTCGGGAPRDCDDAASCTTDSCDPTYGCQHLPHPDVCGDGDPCTEDSCGAPFGEPLTGCLHQPSSGAACDDGNVCTPSDTCLNGQCVGQGNVQCGGCLVCDPQNGCTLVAPEPNCHTPSKPGASSLELREGTDPTADSIKWSWKGRDGTSISDFGMPTGSTTYDLCLFDASSGTPSLLLHSTPAGGLCGSTPCWKSLARSHTYKDKTRAADGLASIKLQVSSFPSSKITLQAKGPNVPPLGLPLAPVPSLVLELRSSNGKCWGATFDAPSINTADRFKAKSD